MYICEYEKGACNSVATIAFEDYRQRIQEAGYVEYNVRSSNVLAPDASHEQNALLRQVTGRQTRNKSHPKKRSFFFVFGGGGGKAGEKELVPIAMFHDSLILLESNDVDIGSGYNVLFPCLSLVGIMTVPRLMPRAPHAPTCLA